MQAYVGRARAESFSLTADMMYVSQNAPRICRALFEICLRRSWSTAADMALTMCKVCFHGMCVGFRVSGYSGHMLKQYIWTCVSHAINSIW